MCHEREEMVFDIDMRGVNFGPASWLSLGGEPDGALPMGKIGPIFYVF